MPFDSQMNELVLFSKYKAIVQPVSFDARTNNSYEPTFFSKSKTYSTKNVIWFKYK